MQTAAFNLPNDERVVTEKGAKRVMLKNVQDAKFAKTLLPISKVVLAPADQKDVSFDAFFTHIVVHELMHGLGPHNITVGGRADHRAAGAEGDLQRHRGSEGRHLGALRAAVPDRQGRRCRRRSRRRSTPRFSRRRFRSIRFGINEAHGRGIAIQLNYLLDQGGFTVRPDGTFAVDHAKIKDGVTALTREIMTIAGRGRLREGARRSATAWASCGRRCRRRSTS